MKLKFLIRDLAKMSVQNVVLPIAYFFAKLKHPGKRTLYVFADAHHTDIPFSLKIMYDRVKSMGIEPACHFYDYTHEGALRSLLHAVKFMDLYAQARYVFICDTFVPVSSGIKDSRTKVVQLCHFSGPIKKIGYATKDDVPGYYNKNVFKNYDLVTVSDASYVPILTNAMRQKEGAVQPLGVSRSDIFYDQQWVLQCRKDFYAQYPDAVNKKIVLWTPTFRGKAAAPSSIDNESMVLLQDKLGEDWLVLIKHHPHDDAVATNPRYRSNCSIATERLLPVVDVLITDYSTTLFDYLAFDKPFVLYASDLEEFERTRGFFVDYRSISKSLKTDAADLDVTIKAVYQKWLEGDREEITRCRDRFASACDGKSTERILKYLKELDHM